MRETGTARSGGHMQATPSLGPVIIQSLPVLYVLIIDTVQVVDKWMKLHFLVSYELSAGGLEYEAAAS